MNRLSTTTIVLFLTLLAGCSDSPSTVLRTLEDAAARGDATLFASCFTEKSRPFAEALLRVQKEIRGSEPSPVEKFSRSTIASETIDGNTAVITATYRDGSSSGIVFVREKGHWKLDPEATTSGRTGRETGLE